MDTNRKSYMGRLSALYGVALNNVKMSNSRLLAHISNPHIPERVRLRYILL